MNEELSSDVVYMPAPSLVDSLTNTGHDLIESARSLLGSPCGEAESNPEYLRAMVELISESYLLWTPSAHQEYDIEDRQYAIQKALTQRKNWRAF